MSYDVWLEIDTGGDEPVRLSSLNYTWNCAPMFYSAFGESGLNGLSGKLAGEAAPIIKRALASMQANPDHYKAMNPSNGWGSYEGAMTFLREFHSDCQQHPKASITIC